MRHSESVEKVSGRENYSKYLSSRTKELNITQQELADAIGVGQKTVSRYENGDSLPKDAVIVKIEKYLIERSVFVYHESGSLVYEFYHIPAEDFTRRFVNMVNLLKDVGVSEKDYSKKIGGASQKTLNNYFNSALRADAEPLYVSTELQYRMISGFRTLARQRIDEGAVEESDACVSEKTENLGAVVSSGIDIAADRLILSALENRSVNFYLMSEEKLGMLHDFLVLLMNICAAIKHHINELYDPYISSCHYGAAPSLPLKIFSWNVIPEMCGNTETVLKGLCQKDAGGKIAAEMLGCFLSDRKTEYLNIFKSLSAEELDAVNKELALLYKEKNANLRAYLRDSKEQYEFIQKEYGGITLGDEDLKDMNSRGYDFTGEAEAFSGCSLPVKKLVLDNFNAFFGDFDLGMTCHRENEELKSWLSGLNYESKAKFVAVFEDELMSGIWRYSANAFYSRGTAFSLLSEYMSLISACEAGVFKNCKKETEMTRRELETADKYRRRFSKLAAGDMDYFGAAGELIKRLSFTSLDWYVFMLIDLAYLEGIPLWWRLFDDIGMFYDMDDYICAFDLFNRIDNKHISEMLADVFDAMTPKEQESYINRYVACNDDE